MRRAACIALYFLVAVPGFASAQNFDWRTISPAGLNFTAEFPGDPTQKPPTTDNGKDGTLYSTSHLIIFQAGGLYCGADVTDYTFKVDIEGELAADRDNFLKTAHGTLGTSQRGDFINGAEKLPELTFTFDLPDKGYHGKSIVVLKGNRVYMLMAMSSNDSQYSGAVDRFLGSLVIDPQSK